MFTVMVHGTGAKPVNDKFLILDAYDDLSRAGRGTLGQRTTDENENCSTDDEGTPFWDTRQLGVGARGMHGDKS